MICYKNLVENTVEVQDQELTIGLSRGKITNKHDQIASLRFLYT